MMPVTSNYAFKNGRRKKCGTSFVHYAKGVEIRVLGKTNSERRIPRTWGNDNLINLLYQA